MNRVLRVFDKVSGTISSAGGFAAGVLVLVIIFIATYEVVMRKFFNSPTNWSIELITFLVLWFAFLALGITQRMGRHIHVDILVGHFSPRTRAIWSLITLTITLAFTVILGYYGWGHFSDALAIGQRSGSSWGPFIAPVRFALSFGCIILGIQLVYELLLNGHNLATKSLEKGKGWRDNPFIVVPIFLCLFGLSIWLLTVVPLAGVLVMVLTLLFAGVPIFASLGIAGIIGIFALFGGSTSLPQIPILVHKTLGEFGMAALPLFITAAFLMERGGVGEDIYDMLAKWIGHFPGGLAIATLLACAFFSAVSLSSVAVAATMCLIALPALLRRNYSKPLAFGVIAAGGTLGIMIPPSGTMILYSIMTGESMGKLLMAGLLPGFMIIAMFSIYAIIECRRTGAYEKEQVWSWKDRWASLVKAIPGLMVPVIIIAGILTGVFTVIESAAIAAFYSLIMVLVRRRIKLRDLRLTLTECGIFAAMILFIMAGALILGRLITLMQVPQTVVNLVMTAGLPPWAVITMMMLLLLVLGLFLECASMMMMTLPILYPVITGLGFSGIWFAVLMTVAMEMSLLTPPVGLNLFVIQSVAKTDLAPVIKGVLPFFLIMILSVVILYLFPQISLFIPNLMMG